MFRQLVVGLWVLHLVGPAFFRTALVIHYYWDRAPYVARCENANRPDLDCYGKCQLKKRLQATKPSEDDGRAALPQAFYEIRDFTLCLPPSLPFLPALKEREAITFPPYRRQECAGVRGSVFHPPCG